MAKKEHVVVPRGFRRATEEYLALTPDTILEKNVEFSCLGNSNVEGFFFDSAQKGRSDLEAAPENHCNKTYGRDDDQLERFPAVVTVELELPFTVLGAIQL